MPPEDHSFEEERLGKPYDLGLLRRMAPMIRPYRLLLLCAVALVFTITLVDLCLPYVTKIAIDRYIVPSQAEEASGADGIRYLSVDLSDPEIRQVVARNASRFRIDGNRARIPYDDLSGLPEEDLRTLRAGDLAGVLLLAAFYLAIAVADFILNFFQAMVMEYTGQMMMHDLRVRLYDHIQRLSVSFFTRNPVGRLVTRVTSDVQNLHELFTSVVTFVFKDLFLLAGIAVVLLSMNWKLALATFAVMPLVAAASRSFAGKARDAFRLLRIKIAEINTRFSETIGGIRVIQLFCKEEHNFKKFADLNHENYLAEMRQIHVLAVFLPVVELLGAVTVAIVVFYGGSQVLERSITLGSLVAFISYMRMFFRPLRDIADKYNLLQSAMASAERIFLILDSREKLPEPDRAFTDGPRGPDRIEEVSFSDVSFGYVPGEPVLQGITFTVRRGEMVAVVGPTGSGKTSLLNLIIRYYDPDSGSVLVNGSDVKTFKIATLRARMALVSQDPFLFSGTVRDNIFHGNSELSDDQTNRMLELSNCRTLVGKLPSGLDSVLSEGGSSLSSGERQLLSIARAFVRDPELILLDEATSYIDSETEHRLQEALRNLMNGRTSIVVAHRLSTARRADRIIVLYRGRIMETGTHDELMGRHGYYYRLNQVGTGNWKLETGNLKLETRNW